MTFKQKYNYAVEFKYSTALLDELTDDSQWWRALPSLECHYGSDSEITDINDIIDDLDYSSLMSSIKTDYPVTGIFPYHYRLYGTMA